MNFFSDLQSKAVYAVMMLLPGSQVSIRGLVQHAAEVVFCQRLLRHLLQLLLPLQGQSVVLQLDALGSSPQSFREARLLQSVDFRC